MPKRFPQEFKRDVVAVSRSSSLTQAQVARYFGISEHSVARWVKQANIDDGLLEQEVEILRRATAYFAKDAAPNVPAGP
jgi:transposase-like protein